VPELHILCPTSATGRVVSTLESRIRAGMITITSNVGHPAGDDLVTADIPRGKVDAMLALVTQVPEGAGLRVWVVPSRQLLPEPDPGDADRVVWAQVTEDVATNGRLSWNNILLIMAASAIAAIGIIEDQPLLIVGAMALSPDYYPIAHTFLALSRRAWGVAGRGALALLAMYGAAAGAAWALSSALTATDLATRVSLSGHPLTLFISRPNGLSVVVALIAGMAGALAITLADTRGLVGVFVSIMTIPAAANVGVATAGREFSELAGAAVQLASNVGGLLLAGTITAALRHRGRAPRHHPSSRG
jgi:uncharacterized hydrophobic protein (TIGR00271 family)